MLYKVITDWVDLEKMFDEDGREGHFSSYGYQFILDWYEELNGDMEAYAPDLDECFDEYGSDCFYSLQDFIDDYECYYPLNEYLDDNDLNEEEYYKDNYIQYLVDYVDRFSPDLFSCTLLENGNVMIVRQP